MSDLAGYQEGEGGGGGWAGRGPCSACGHIANVTWDAATVLCTHLPAPELNTVAADQLPSMLVATLTAKFIKMLAMVTFKIESMVTVTVTLVVMVMVLDSQTCDGLSDGQC